MFYLFRNSIFLGIISFFFLEITFLYDIVYALDIPSQAPNFEPVEVPFSSKTTNTSTSSAMVCNPSIEDWEKNFDPEKHKYKFERAIEEAKERAKRWENWPKMTDHQYNCFVFVCLIITTYCMFDTDGKGNDAITLFIRSFE